MGPRPSRACAFHLYESYSSFTPNNVPVCHRMITYMRSRRSKADRMGEGRSGAEMEYRKRLTVGTVGSKLPVMPVHKTHSTAKRKPAEHERLLRTLRSLVHYSSSRRPFLVDTRAPVIIIAVSQCLNLLNPLHSPPKILIFHHPTPSLLYAYAGACLCRNRTLRTPSSPGDTRELMRPFAESTSQLRAMRTRCRMRNAPFPPNHQ